MKKRKKRLGLVHFKKVEQSEGRRGQKRNVGDKVF